MRAKSILANVRALIEKEWPDITDVKVFVGEDRIKGRIWGEATTAPVFWSRKKDLYACPSCFVLVHDKDMVNHTRWHMGDDRP